MGLLSWVSMAAAAAVVDALGSAAWPARARPDLGVVVLAVAAVAGTRGAPRWVAPWLCGWAKDLLSAGRFGVYALAGLLVGAAWEAMARRLNVSAAGWRILGCAVAAGAVRVAVGVILGGVPGAMAVGASAVAAAAIAVAGSLRSWIGTAWSSSSALR